MKIVAAGGGSGGHVTPVLAVINELKKFDADLQVCFITDSKFGRQAETILKKATVPVRVRRIIAGKFRRYHGIPWYRQHLNILMGLQNIRDVLFVAIGSLQSIWIVGRFRPDVIFTKGGFVCVPVGVAARLFHIPLVIHDSDAHPGLASRILSKWATTIATGAPIENYPYPKSRTHYVGIPIDETFKPVTAKEQRELKLALGFKDANKPLVVVTGGGLGALNINRAVMAIAPALLKKDAILQITGDASYEEIKEKAVKHPDYVIKRFIATGMAPLFGAADIVVTRAGATTINELAAMAKPIVLVPNPLLSGGHQLKNAAVYAKAKAAVVIEEDKMVVSPLYLKREIDRLLASPELRTEIGKRLQVFSKPEAAVDMAALIAEAAVTYRHQKAAE